MPTVTKLTDPFFAKLLVDISANNTLFFTPRQLHYLLDRRVRSRAIQGGLGASIVLMLFGLIPVVIFIFLQPSLIAVTPAFFIAYAAFWIWSAAQNSLSQQLNRRGRQDNIKILKILAGVLFLVGLPISIITQSILGIVSSIGLGLGAAWLSVDRQRKQVKVFDEFLIDRNQFNAWLSKWISINDPPEKILPEPQTIRLPATPNPDVIAYSFDRLVVCNSVEIAQLLISNNFHFENNCAVLTIDGYPQSIFDTTMTMLRRNPQLKVYALHDCSPVGVQMIGQLRQTEKWFPDPAIPIIDVGILPRQITNNVDVSIRQSNKAAQAAQQLTTEVRASLNPDELSWLDVGCYLDLESFPPQKLIQILQRAISESRELGTIEGGNMVIIDDSGAGGGFYTVESFG
jgi:hypothetical protein